MKLGISVDNRIFRLLFAGCTYLGAKMSVVTLGPRGVMFSDGKTIGTVEAPKVHAVDTTGAGDCFVGWLGAGIGEGLSLPAAMRRACKAASMAASRAGVEERHALSTRSRLNLTSEIFKPQISQIRGEGKTVSANYNFVSGWFLAADNAKLLGCTHMRNLRNLRFYLLSSVFGSTR